MNPLTLRRWHAYIGSFVAPSVLFFTLTGAVQLFSWHEAHGDYRPPVLLERLSSLHKDQVLNRHEDGAEGRSAEKPVASEPAEPSAAHEEKPLPPATFALKLFFFLIAIGVTLSTCFGIWMSLTQTPRKGVIIGLLVAGTSLPLILLAF